MVATQLAARGLADRPVLDVMARVPRHCFVPAQAQPFAYRDQPLPIGYGQKLPSPHAVAVMTQALRLKSTDSVLEIGTGSGYQTAILCELASYVYSIECRPVLAGRAARVLNQLGYENLDIHVGDGSQGLLDMAPFDAILVTAAAPTLLPQLSAQLSPDGGRLVLPVGSLSSQYLHIVTRQGDTFYIDEVDHLRLSPLVGRNGFYMRSYSD
jgi:protein-L-isoaspartate(D-aspartate) O-methyltransferase